VYASHKAAQAAALQVPVEHGWTIVKWVGAPPTTHAVSVVDAAAVGMKMDART